MVMTHVKTQNSKGFVMSRKKKFGDWSQRLRAAVRGEFRARAKKRTKKDWNDKSRE